MSIFLTLAYLFFCGSVFGWILELLFRNLTQRRKKKWINPGFCTGPYLPIYGFGLCILYLLASLEDKHFIPNPLWNKVVLIFTMAAGMTLIEYLAGLLLLKSSKVRLWDYSDLPGNIQGIICPQFSLVWAMFSALYDFLIHPHIISALEWLSRNLAFSFFIGMFFGIFLIDFVHSGHLIVKIKRFAEENRVILKYEGIKAHIQSAQEKASQRYHFFFPFHSQRPLSEYLKEIVLNLEKQKRKQQPDGAKRSKGTSGSPAAGSGSEWDQKKEKGKRIKKPSKK